MEIKSFFKTLAGNIDRSQLLRQLEETESNILKIDIPAIGVAQDLIGSKKVKSQVIKDFHKNLHHVTKNSDTLIPALYANASIMPGTINAIRDAIKSVFSEKISSTGISYLQLNLLNMVEALEFYSCVTRTYLRWIYDEEAVAVNKDAERHVVRAEITRLLNDRIAFCRLIDFFHRYNKNISSVLEKTVDAVFDEDTYQVIQSNHGLSKIDPCNLFVAGVRYNIFWHIGKLFTELQLSRYKSNKEEKQALDLRALRLKEIMAGHPTTETEKELTFVEDKLKRVKAEIAELEAKYGV